MHPLIRYALAEHIIAERLDRAHTARIAREARAAMTATHSRRRRRLRYTLFVPAGK
jgi:hypothetical protein